MLNIGQLMEIMSDQIEANVAGKVSEPNQIKSANLLRGQVDTVLRMAKLQIDYARLTGASPSLPLLEGSPTPAPDFTPTRDRALAGTR